MTGLRDASRRVVLAGLAGSASAAAVASTARGQTTPADRGAEKIAVAQMFRDYMAAFSEGDIKTAASHYDEPVSLVLQASARGLATASETEAWLAGVRAGMRSRGVVDVIIDELSVKILGKSVAMLSTSYRRRAKDGGTLERAGSTYFLRKTDRGWKISAVTAHPPEDTARFE